MFKGGFQFLSVGLARLAKMASKPAPLSAGSRSRSQRRHGGAAAAAALLSAQAPLDVDEVCAVSICGFHGSIASAHFVSSWTSYFLGGPFEWLSQGRPGSQVSFV